MKKRFLSLLMALCLMLTLAPAAFATDVEDVPVDGQIVADVPETDAADPVEEPEAALVEETPAEEPVEEPVEEVPEAVEEIAEETEPWDGQPSDSLEKVNGYYQIGSAADLLKFANLVNEDGETSANGALTADIDYENHNFFPIGGYAAEDSTSKAYSGTFEGNGHTIKNATISQATNMGIFGFVEGGTIQNLTVDYITSTVTSAQSGNEPAAAAAIGSIHQGYVINVTVGSNCTVSGQIRTGGVIGSARDKVTITNCKNYASVTGTGMYTGGVVGVAHDIDTFLVFVTGSPATVTGCYNYGAVSGNTEVGGIIGYTDQTTVTDCHNSGTVSASGNYGSGGIIGFDAYNPRTGYTPSKGANVSNCTNSGTITGSRSGGIVGTLGVTPGQSQPTSSKVLTTISDCENTGDINGTSGKCGAIFGYQITYRYGDGSDYINNLIVKISNCTNSGKVNNETTTVLTSSPYVQ